MNAVRLLETQLQGTNLAFHDLLDDLTEVEWHSRPSPAQNRVAFASWHIPRVQDHFVFRWIRNLPEICMQEQWRAWRPLQAYSAGIGIPLSDADTIARQVQRLEVLQYADTVSAGTISWLQTLSETELDDVPNTTAHVAAFAECQTAGYQADTNHLHHRPIWRLLSGPCILHVREHLGELALHKAWLRRR